MTKWEKIIGTIFIVLVIVTAAYFLMKDTKNSSFQTSKSNDQQIQVMYSGKHENQHHQQGKTIGIKNAKLEESEMLTALRKEVPSIKSVSISENDIEVLYEDDMKFWDETSLFQVFAMDTTKMFSRLFSRSDISKVTVTLPTSFYEGSESTVVKKAFSIMMTKSTSDKIDYPKMLSEISNQPSAIYKAADAYYIDETLFQSMNQEYAKELNNNHIKP